MATDPLEFPVPPTGPPSTPAAVRTALNATGIDPDRITALPGNLWAVQTSDGDPLAGISYGHQSWCVNRRDDDNVVSFQLMGTLDAAVSELARIVHAYDEDDA